MWEIKNSIQIISFFAALVLGVIISLCYDILRAVRKCGKNSFWAVLVTDIFFSFLSAVVTFLFFMVFTSGQIRFYVIFAEGLGFCICRVSISIIWLKVLMFSIIKMQSVFRCVLGILHRFSGFVCTQADCISDFIQKNFKKARNKLKKLLKKM